MSVRDAAVLALAEHLYAEHADRQREFVGRFGVHEPKSWEELGDEGRGFYRRLAAPLVDVVLAAHREVTTPESAVMAAARAQYERSAEPVTGGVAPEWDDLSDDIRAQWADDDLRAIVAVVREHAADSLDAEAARLRGTTGLWVEPRRQAAAYSEAARWLRGATDGLANREER